MSEEEMQVEVTARMRHIVYSGEVSLAAVDSEVSRIIVWIAEQALRDLAQLRALPRIDW